MVCVFALYRQVRVLGMDKSKGVIDVTMDTELVKVRSSSLGCYFLRTSEHLSATAASQVYDIHT